MNEADRLGEPAAVSKSLSCYVPELDDDIKFNDEEVIRTIKKMKSNKAPGIDGLSAEVYKALNSQFISILTTLFNHILRTGLYP